MVLTHPELVVAEVVEQRGQREVALELQRRALPQGVVRGEEGAEAGAGRASGGHPQRLRRMARAAPVESGLVPAVVGSAPGVADRLGVDD